ncbi:ATP-dependent nuclease [Sedimenticola selenatireducens]|uniref:ATP-dependent nuclease n=1 Tax=Sedimenticola selenatireducens TaxID=191960 RepID=UPI00048AD671|nr:AAA family ATPase [Sedimenticola selenatireducens]
MAKVITKVKLRNFKRFQEFELHLQPERNLLLGDNESGKSSILQAIDLVLAGSRSKVETLGIESLFNVDAVLEFLAGAREYGNLPELKVELYLNEQHNPDLNGNNNLDGTMCDGLALICSPMEEYSEEIAAILKDEDVSFPFEYYSIKFRTFAGEPYGGPRKYLRHLLLDSTQINNEYATREYVKSVYRTNSEDGERHKHQNEYRKHKAKFRDAVLSDVNAKLDTYQFSIATSKKSNLESDLTITEDDISIDNKGRGKQCFIKTEFALQKKKSTHPLDVLLLEEPENHLSHTSMKRLVTTIAHAEEQQMVVTTHNSLISTRLDLRNAVLLNSTSTVSAALSDLSPETADFFMKAPDNNVLEFVLSGRVILVEGDAEYILMQALFKQLVGTEIDTTDIHVISVGGTSFKRYLEVARLLGVRTAVLRDNDGDFEKNCQKAFESYLSDSVRVFSETDNDIRTFEISIYQNNAALCDEMFSGGRIRLPPQEYMLSNKTTVALRLLEEKAENLVVPGYIGEAITWINE